MSILSWVTKHAPTILTWCGAAGVVGTSVLSAKATPEAMKRREAAQKTKDEGEKLTTLELVKAMGPCYIPTGIVGAMTLACIFGSNGLNKRRQAALAAAIVAIQQGAAKYSEAARQIFGEKGEEMVRKAVAQEDENLEKGRPGLTEKVHFVLTIGTHEIWFDSTLYSVMEAEYLANRILTLRGDVHVNEFLKLLGQDAIDDGDENGWNLYIGETTMGYQWIDFYHNWDETESGEPMCWIECPFDAHPLDEKKLNEWLDSRIGGPKE